MSHAFFAPSAAPRVVQCPASLLLTMDMPDTQSEFAAEGTAAHFIADLSLRNRCHVSKYAGCYVAVSMKGECVFQHLNNSAEIMASVDAGTSYLFEVNDEMVVAVQEYVDWCNDAPGEKYPECRVDVSKWAPEIPEHMIFLPPAAYEPQKGTSDHAACEPRRLIITDLKYGKGVKVYADMNYQAVLYALGFIDEWDWLYDFEEIEIRICQPRLDHKDTWVITRTELEEIGRYILERYTLALQPDAPYGPSEKACTFCKASGQCRAQADYLSKIRALAFDDLDGPPTFAEPNPGLLTLEELVEAWRARKLVNARFDAIERLLLQSHENGCKLPGIRIVESRSHRKWINPDIAVDELLFATDIKREKLFDEPSLISPSQVEKLLPKKKREIVKTLAYVPRGGPCIVDEADKRPDYEVAVNAQVGEVFDDLDDPFA